MRYAISIALGLVLVSSASVAQALDLKNIINIEANVSGTANDSASTDASASSSLPTHASAKTSGSVTATNNANIEVGPVILITRAAADASPTTSATVTSASSVGSRNDLSAYASGMVKADADVSGVQLSDTSVSVSYKQRAHLFGFIPVFVDATASVGSDGETTVTYPWYAVFATTDSTALQSDVQAATAATVSSDTAQGALSVSGQAKLLAEIHDAMKTHLQQSLAADASANSNVSTQ
jgi:hypothetical protein